MIKKFGNALLFIFVLGVFCFSLSKILMITDIFKGDLFGQNNVYSCDEECPSEYDCGLCGLFGSLCGDFGNWCDQSCGCPTPTPEEPTPTPEEPTPTPECPTPTPEEPTPTPEEPTPTPEEPTPTRTPTPTATPEPANGDGDDGGNGGPPGPPVCGDECPGKTRLLSVMPIASVELKWTEAERATHYSIVYGPSPGNYLYGVTNTGKVTSYIIDGLDESQTYCFAVRPVNNCMPGELSNEICTGNVGGGQVLGATTLGETGGIDWARIALLCYGLGMSCLGLSRGFKKSRLIYVH